MYCWCTPLRRCFSKNYHMKHLKKIIRVCALILFLLLAVTGMSITGVAAVLNKDRKLFADEESKIEMVEENADQISEKEQLKA